MLTKKQIMKILYKKYDTDNIPLPPTPTNICYKTETISCRSCPYRTINIDVSTQCFTVMYNDYITYIKLIAWNNLL